MTVPGHPLNCICHTCTKSKEEKMNNQCKDKEGYLLIYEEPENYAFYYNLIDEKVYNELKECLDDYGENPDDTIEKAWEIFRDNDTLHTFTLETCSADAWLYADVRILGVVQLIKADR